MPTSTHREGLTLLEVLAVVVLLGVISVVLAASPFLQRHVTLDESAGLSRVTAIEHRARLGAVGLGGRLRIQGTTWWIETVNGPTAFIGDGVEVSESRDLRLIVDGKPADRLVYDTRGRSADAVVILQRADGEHRLRIDGMTGRWSIATEGSLRP